MTKRPAPALRKVLTTHERFSSMIPSLKRPCAGHEYPNASRSTQPCGTSRFSSTSCISMSVEVFPTPTDPERAITGILLAIIDVGLRQSLTNGVLPVYYAQCPLMVV